MNQIDEKYWTLLSKSLSNNLSTAEEKELKDWLASDLSHQQLLQELEESWNAADYYGNRFLPNKEQAWKNISDRLELDADIEQAPVRKLFTWTRAAVAVVLVMLSSLAIWYATNQPEWVQIASANTIKKVILPDGSNIWLSPNSSVRYLDDMNEKKQREVVMEGEAFFEVTHNPARPFIVQALETETKVLGTSFNVLARAEMPVIQVSVVTGRVQFRNSNAEKNKLVLEPGSRGIYTKSTAVLIKQQTANKNFLFWKNQKLEFSNATVLEALEDLEKSYGVQFIIKDTSISSKRIITSFQQESIEQIVAELKVLLDVEITKSDTTSYVIRSINSF